MDETNSLRRQLSAGAASLLHQAARTSWTLFKIMVPISIVTRVLQQAGAIVPLGGLLAPVMHLVGLPGSMGLVWATAMVTNLYGGMAAYASLAPGEGLTAAQATVLTTMILVAHGFPVELTIARKAGVRFWCMASLRTAGALALGCGLRWGYSWGGFLQTPSALFWQSQASGSSWASWAVGQAKSLAMIYLIILGLLLLMEALKRAGITALLTRLLRPVLRVLGMSEAAAPVTIIGMTLGLSYGGGLIIQEAQSGRLGRRDVFFSLALMGLCHSLIEDTLMMMALGGRLSGTLWARLFFSVAVVAALARLLSRLSDEAFRRVVYVASTR
jgi:hypothetical protein